jgi:hypothetical protein
MDINDTSGFASIVQNVIYHMVDSFLG